jgi:protein-S-isoprenylcysteine O-methyltransferase Ste14
VTLSLLANVPLPQGHTAGVVGVVVMDHLVPIHWPGRVRGQRPAGLVLVLIGAALNVWAVAERRRVSTGAFRLEEPEGLVTSGPYALTRHPMYLGWGLLHLGIGLAHRSAWVLLTLPAAIAIDQRAAVREDAELTRAFGDDFDRYRHGRPTILELLSRGLTRPATRRRSR